MTRVPAALGATLCVVLAMPAAAVEFDQGDLRLEFTSQLRALYTYSREIDTDDFLEGTRTRRDRWLLLTRARFDFEAAWRDRLYSQVVYDVEGRTGSGLDSLRFDVAEEIGTRTWLDADSVYSDHGSFHGMHLLYRAWLRYEGERWDATVGRQRIPLGRARLWNPTDLFNPIFPLAIEGDQRIGQDSVVARWQAVDDVWAMGIWSPQDDLDQHRWVLRGEIVKPALDAALMVGAFERDWVVGMDFARNLGDAAIRGEATHTDPRQGDSFWQVVLSIDYTFPVGNGLYALVEHLWNENLLPSAAALPFTPSVAQIAFQQTSQLNRITTVSRNQTGFQLGYEWSPLLRTDLLWLYDYEGPSAAIFPSIGYSPRDDLELSISAQLFVGPDDTEYGDVSNLFFVRADLYF